MGSGGTGNQGTHPPGSPQASTPATPERVAALEQEARRARSELAQSQEQLDRLMNLYVAISQLHASLDPERVQNTIAEIAVDLLGARAFVVLLKDAGTGDTLVAFTHGARYLPASAPRDRYRGGDPLVDQALHDGTLALGAASGSQAVAAVPLIIDGRTVGAMVVYALLAQKDHLAEADRDLLDVLAAHAATALVASRVYARADRKLRTLEGLITLGDAEGSQEHSLQGSLADLSFAELLQFTSFSERTGTLRVRSGEKEGRLILFRGKVLEARAPTVPTLLDAMTIDGVVTPRMAAAARKGARQVQVQPLTLLLRAGRITEAQVQESAHKQVEAAISALVQWRRGHFELEVGRLDLRQMALEDARRLVSVNAQMLLLDALRRQDEAERDQGGLVFDADVDLDAVELPAEPAPVQPAEPAAAEPKDDDWSDLGEDLADEMAGAPRRESADPVRRALQELRVRMATGGVSVQLMDLVSTVAERAILFVVRRNDLVPIGAFGAAADARPLAEHVRELVLPLDYESELRRLLMAGSPVRIELPDSRIAEGFVHAVGPPSSGTIALIPVMGTERPVLVVYADNGDKAEPIADLETLELIGTPLGLALENEFLRRRIAALDRG